MSQPVAFGRHEKTIHENRWMEDKIVLDRYNIGDEKDLADAGAKLDRKAQQRKRHSKDTVVPKVLANHKTSSMN
jgi:hypothetical protein